MEDAGTPAVVTLARHLQERGGWRLRTGLGGLDVFVLRHPAEQRHHVNVHDAAIPVVLRALA